MMKCIIRVEPPLMFNINKNRAHDVRKKITQLADEDGGRGANLKGKQSSEGNLRLQKAVEKENCYKKKRLRKLLS